MKHRLGAFAAVGPLLVALCFAQTASAQKAGGTLKIGHFASPASMSMLEESTLAVNRPMMGVFNNLVIFKQDEPQNTPDAIVPELATGWTWSEDATELTFPLHKGVKWHDGKPFTAADVKCTIDLLQGKAKEKLRINPRKSWFDNVSEVTANGDYEVTFHLKRPQPSLLSMQATGWTPMYPCHVSPAQMRQHPIGTGPFKFVEFKPNQSIAVTRNPDLRRAMSLTIDRQAFVDIIVDGQGAIGGVMQPPPEGVWGMPIYAMRKLPGYDPDIASSRAKAVKIMEKLGYGPNNRLKVTVSTRKLAPYTNPAV